MKTVRTKRELQRIKTSRLRDGATVRVKNSRYDVVYIFRKYGDLTGTIALPFDRYAKGMRRLRASPAESPTSAPAPAQSAL